MIRYKSPREGFIICYKDDDIRFAEITKNENGVWGLSYLDEWLSKEELSELVDTINKLNEG